MNATLSARSASIAKLTELVSDVAERVILWLIVASWEVRSMVLSRSVIVTVEEATPRRAARMMIFMLRSFQALVKLRNEKPASGNNNPVGQANQCPVLGHLFWWK